MVEQGLAPEPAAPPQEEGRPKLTRRVDDEVIEKRLSCAGVASSLTEADRGDALAGGEARAQAGSHRSAAKATRPEMPGLLRGRVKRWPGVQPDARGKVGWGRRRRRPDGGLDPREETPRQLTEGRERR